MVIDLQLTFDLMLAYGLLDFPLPIYFSDLNLLKNITFSQQDFSSLQN